MSTQTQTATQHLALTLQVLPDHTAAALREQFEEYVKLAEDWAARARAIVVTDENDKGGMAMAREGRLLLQKKRTGLEGLRKQLKENSLREGRAIDEIAKTLTGLIEPTERYLKEQETFAERAKAARDEARRTERTALLAPWGVNPAHYDLVGMDDAAFAELLDGLRLAAEAKAEADRKAAEEAKREAEARAAAEAARLAAEKAERERIEAENAELRRKEAEARAAVEVAEAAARAEHEKHEAELRAAREAEARAAAELHRQQEEARRRKEEEDARALAEHRAALAAERKARNAPDKDKLLGLAAQLEALPLPVVKSDDAAAVLLRATGLLTKLVADIRTQADTL